MRLLQHVHFLEVGFECSSELNLVVMLQNGHACHNLVAKIILCQNRLEILDILPIVDSFNFNMLVSDFKHICLKQHPS